MVADSRRTTTPVMVHTAVNCYNNHGWTTYAECRGMISSNASPQTIHIIGGRAGTFVTQQGATKKNNKWLACMTSFAAHQVRGARFRNGRVQGQYCVRCKGMVEWDLPDVGFPGAAGALFAEVGLWGGADDAFSGCEEAPLPAPSTWSRILL